MRRLLFSAALAVAGCAGVVSNPGGSLDPLSDVAPPGRDAVTLPLKEGSLRFAVIGDTGTAARIQLELARQMAAWHERVGFTFVLMTGDNIYGADTPAEMKRKFEDPYASLLGKDIKFYATLGNHDNPNQRFYKLYNMGGEQYYTFRPKMGARFFAIDSNYIDQKQLAWLEKELAASGSEWKIVFFHHPLYSSGLNHGPALSTREVLEPIFVKHGVSVVLTGHEHFYERIKPQKGITHIVAGSSAKLRKGNIGASEMTAKGFDQGYAFILMEIDGDVLQFQTINEVGKTVDAGNIQREDKKTIANGLPRQPK